MCYSVAKSQGDHLQAFEVSLAHRRDAGKALVMVNLIAPSFVRAEHEAQGAALSDT